MKRKELHTKMVLIIRVYMNLPVKERWGACLFQRDLLLSFLPEFISMELIQQLK